MSNKWLLTFAGVVLFATLTSCGNSGPGFAVSPAPPPETAAGVPQKSADVDLSTEEVRQLLREHNRVRAEVDVGPVAWSDTIARHAREWADHLAESGCRMEHRPKSGTWAGPYGENLFIGTAGYYGVVDAVRAWESEKRYYRGEVISQGNFGKVGHYTQLVWRGTQRIGCGKAECQGNIILVCNYDPPGNFLGEKPY